MPEAHSIAAGLSPPFAGQLTYPLCQKYSTAILTVSDEQILGAMTSIYRRMGVVLEPSGVAALAALLYHKIPIDIRNKTVMVVLSGRNIDFATFSQLVA